MAQWIWEKQQWPRFSWDKASLEAPLARARLAQGRILGAVGILDPTSARDAIVDVLVGDGVATSAIEGERLDAHVDGLVAESGVSASSGSLSPAVQSRWSNHALLRTTAHRLSKNTQCTE